LREFNWNQQAQGGKILTINGRGCTIVGYKNDMGMALINVENELKAMGFTVKADVTPAVANMELLFTPMGEQIEVKASKIK
jgi:hypothetical protein